jgi:hypothetical protein
MDVNLAPKEKRKPRSKKRTKEDEDAVQISYKEMSLKDLQKLLADRGLQKANRKSLAIILLESHDKGVDLSAPKINKPKKFKPTIQVLRPTTLYSDQTKPFNGVPMDVLVRHLFNRLDYSDKVALAKTCRNFYAPLMKNICVTFQLFLIKFSEELIVRNLKGIDQPYIRPIAPKAGMQDIIDHGIGITPLAVAYAYKGDIPTRVGEAPGLISNAPKIEKLIRLIHRYGTLDNYLNDRKTRKLQNKKWIQDIKVRIEILNKAVNSLGYSRYNSAELFEIHGELTISIYCNSKSFINPKGRLSTEIDKSTSILYNYIREGVEFNWALLPKYIADIAQKCHLINRESAEAKAIETKLGELLNRSQEPLNSYICYLCTTGYCVLHDQ